MASSKQPPEPTSTAPPRQPQRISRAAAPGGGPALDSIVSRRRVRNIVWTGVFAAITIVGTIYGAGLKTKQDYKAEKKKVMEAPIEDRIRGLEERRAALVSQKAPLESKLDELRVRIAKAEAAAATTTTTNTTTGGDKK
ncbi:hypothetical protein AAE478_008517 [Parahypoxylon ruwenzoriense]